MEYEELIGCLVQQTKIIFEKNLTGIYLHGSIVMGCFRAEKSDIDVLVVVKDHISNEKKRAYMDRIVEWNKQAPAKGIELSIVREEVCNPFVYPTPFELHFSAAHLEWYKSDPDDYIEKMKGTDKDLAAHFTMISHRGKAIYGKSVKEVFAEVSRENYLDSVWYDIENAQEEITENPTYFTLNLCRTLAFVEEHLILSKQEGGEWGLLNVPQIYRELISDALMEYQNGTVVKLNESLAREYAAYMLERIAKAY